jgi:hypothetical protein
VWEDSAAKEAGWENFLLDWLNTPYAEERLDQEE